MIVVWSHVEGVGVLERGREKLVGHADVPVLKGLLIPGFDSSSSAREGSAC